MSQKLPENPHDYVSDVESIKSDNEDEEEYQSPLSKGLLADKYDSKKELRIALKTYINPLRKNKLDYDSEETERIADEKEDVPEISSGKVRKGEKIKE